MRTLVYVVLLVVLAVSVPMAHATPVDQTWIPGLYDNADGDASILALTSLASAADVHVAPRPVPLEARSYRSQPDDDPSVRPDIHGRVQNRAPPAA